MRINFVCKGVLVAATLCAGPAVLLASPKADQPGARVVKFNKGASPNDTSSLLRQIQSDALNVKNNAGQLQALLSEGFLTDWRDDAVYLGNVRDRVNEMNKLLSYLRVHQAEASPLEQKIIERVALPSLELAGTTQDAIVTLKNNRAALYMSDLPGLANDIYKEASLIDQTVGNFEKYSNLRHEAQQLRQALRLNSGS